MGLDNVESMDALMNHAYEVDLEVQDCVIYMRRTSHSHSSQCS